MNKAGKKTRDIYFRSEKNNSLICVHSEIERAYAKELESCLSVASYETGVTLRRDHYCYVNPIGIRKLYFDTDWASDFLIKFEDGSTGIRELILKDNLRKKSEIEKLEFSHRYWAAERVNSWKIIVVERRG